MDARKIAASLDSLLAGHASGHLLLNISSHEREAEFNKAMSAPPVLAVFQKHGFYHFALEARQEFQKTADDIAAGKARPEDLGQAAVDGYRAVGDASAESGRGIYNDRGKFVQEASRRGFMVHFVESQGTLDENLAMLERTAAAQKIADGIIAGERPITSSLGSIARGGLARLFGESAKEDFQRGQIAEHERDKSAHPYAAKMLDSVMKHRLDHDKTLAETIIARSGGARTVVAYGAEHGRNQNDLSEHLGGDTIRIMMCADKTACITAQQEDYSGNYQKPHAYLNIESGEMISGDDAFKVSEKYPRAQMRPGQER